MDGRGAQKEAFLRPCNWQYAEGDVLRGAIEKTSAGPFWTHWDLRDVSDWTLERDPISGSYSLTRDLSQIE